MSLVSRLCIYLKRTYTTKVTMDDLRILTVKVIKALRNLQHLMDHETKNKCNEDNKLTKSTPLNTRSFSNLQNSARSPSSIQGEINIIVRIFGKSVSQIP